MSFWQQLNQLLSEAPGNIVYHLVTLFAIQATLAIALSQWRREQVESRPAGERGNLARRLTVSAIVLLLARALFLLVSLVLAGEGERVMALRVLPPLEQALNTLSLLAIVWAMLPALPALPRLNDVVAVLLLLVLGVMYTFFAQAWLRQGGAGVTYNSSAQSTLWGVAQLIILGTGFFLLVLARFPSRGLRLLPIAVLLVAHLLQFWNYPEQVPSNSEIPFWIRLGHLIAFPLLAVLAYRHSLQQLLLAQDADPPAGDEVTGLLSRATEVLGAPTLGRMRAEAAQMAAELLDTAFVGLAMMDSENPDRLSLVRTASEESRPREWELNLGNWPAFRLAMEQEEPVELLPTGMGARQLHELYQEMGVQEVGPLLIVPLHAGDNVLGVLLLGGRPHWENWSGERRSQAPQLAHFVARALANAQAYEAAVEDVPPVTAASEALVSGRIITLEEERDRARKEMRRLEDKLRRSDAKLVASQRKVHDLANTVEALEMAQPDDTDVEGLQAEIDALRESLIEAEEALAMAAASEGELSTEWVMQTISRYSGELEEAQMRILELEDELTRREPDQANEVVTALAQELRTPLTSIAGYTDLLLGETMGILGTRQRDFLQRVRANVERMGVLLEQIVQMASTPARAAAVTEKEPVELNEVIDAAVNTIIGQIRKKELRLNLLIADSLPPVPANREALSQVLIHLLNNASQVSENRSALTLSARDALAETTGPNGATARERFVHISIRDSGGGIQPEERTHVFDPQYRAENPLIAGLGDTGAGLSVAETLVHAHGGRIWVDSTMGEGSTFSVLLPLEADGQVSGA